jgi:exosortase A-associated hydrolase 1
MSSEALVIDCEGAQLVGLLHPPAAATRTLGVVIIVGGPQYRVGSHRQFVLLSRALAQAGYPVLRFDYRGMGDSDGELRGFEHIHNDVRCAIDALLMRMPQLRQVVLWGLCDGASAASFYAADDARVRGVALLNPWVRGEQSLARSLLFNYYVARLFNRQAWRELLGQRSKLSAALKSVLTTARRALATAPSAPPRASAATSSANSVSAPLLPRVASGLEKFRGAILLVIAGADLTGAEFVQGIARHRGLRRRLGRPDVTRKVLEVADHTFSTRAWRDQVAHWTCEWLETLAPVSPDRP